MSTPTERTALDLVRDIYDALARKDLATVLQLTDPEIVVVQDPALPWGGHHVGHDGLAAFAAALTGTIDSKVTIEALFQAGDAVVQYGRTVGTVRATGVAFDIPECHLWRVRDGRAVEARYFIDSDAMQVALA
ncbi:hypothetical protein BH20ACT3_BH20ACT3_08200 [soil metagenome]